MDVEIVVCAEGSVIYGKPRGFITLAKKPGLLLVCFEDALVGYLRWELDGAQSLPRNW